MLIKLINISSIRLISLFLLKQFSLLKNNAEVFYFFFKIFNINSNNYIFFDYFYKFLNFYFRYVNNKLKKKRKLYVLQFIKNLKFFFLKEYKLKYFYLNFLKKLCISFCVIKVVFKSHNIFINVMNPFGKNLKLYSSGFLGFKCREKTTLLASRELAKEVSKFIEKYFSFVEINFIGKKGYIKSIIEGLLFKNSLNLSRISIIDKTPHGGCRLKKKTRK